MITDIGLFMRENFPNGDPEFYRITAEELEMYNVKNKDYAGGGKDPNGNFNRVATTLAMYPGLKLSDPRVISLVYMMKQLDQVFWSLNRGYEGEVEGLDARLADIHIYAKITRVQNRNMTERDMAPAFETVDEMATVSVVPDNCAPMTVEEMVESRIGCECGCRVNSAPDTHTFDSVDEMVEARNCAGDCGCRNELS